MKQICNPRFDETYYTKVLDNGLTVVIWHKPLFTATSCILATPYGALDHIQQDENGNLISDPSGIAHFLEHKMFECEHGDVMTDFSQMGANVNAYTSYTETCYTFSTCMKDINKPLNLLLDFVQSLNITEESVEKEKGIIIQELAMYQQMPDSRLFFETFKALYSTHPLKEDIGGNAESVSSTTKALLETCYTRNYHPSKMVMCIVTPHDPMNILNIVNDNQKDKHFTEAPKISRAPISEPAECAITDHVIEMDLSCNKVAYAFKFSPIFKADKDRAKDEWAVRCLLESHFSSLNPDYQKWLDEGIINDYFFFEVDFGKDYATMMFANETKDKQSFKSFINQQIGQLKEKSISLSLLNQLKKRYAGQAMRIFNSPDDIAASAVKGLFSGVDIFTTIQIIESLAVQQIKETFNSLDFTHSSLIEIKPESQKN